MSRRVFAPALLFLGATVSGASGANAPRLSSGVYEGLELTVAPDGAVAGSFTRDAAALPHRICAFSFTGHLQPDGGATVDVRSPSPVPEAKPIRGRLSAANDGVALKAEGVTLYPACDQLGGEDPRTGLDFSRTGAADGSWIASVTAPRAQLYRAATGTAWRGYLVKGDDVVLGRRQGDRWQAVYLSPEGVRSQGWLDQGDVKRFEDR